MATSAPTYDSVVSGAATEPNLVSWLKLANAVDADGTLGTGTPSGGVAFSGSKVPSDSAGPSASFDGTGQIAFTHNIALELAAGTLIVFVQPATGFLSTARMGIVQRLRTAVDNTDFGVHWWGDTSELVFEIHDGAAEHQCRASGVLNEGAPACIIATWGPAGMMLMVNGQLVATGSYTGGVPAAGGRDWLVGCRAPGGSPGHFWAGLISHVQVYDRVLTTGEIAELCPYTTSGDLLAVTSRSPTLYYPLTDASSTSLGSAALTLTQIGTVASKDANGWNLGGTSHLSVAHSTLFEADTGTINRWVNSEVALSFEAVPNSLASRQFFLSKASGAPGSRLDSSWWVFAETDGTVVARVERNEYVTEIRTPPGYAQVGVRLRGALLFGFNGLGLMLDGRVANDGLRNVRDWFGWDHRVRGNQVLAQGYRMVCNHPLHIGGDGAGGNSNVTMRHVAVWATGATNVDPWVRTTPLIDEAAVQAIHGLSGGPIASHRFAGSTVSVLVADTAATKRSKIQNASAGQVITFQAGTHTLNAGDLVIPDGVRLVGLGAARGDTVIALSSGSEFRFGVGAGSSPGNLATWSNLGNGSGDLAKGAMSWSTPGTSVSLQAGDMIQFVSTVTFIGDGGGDQVAQRRSELAVVERVQGGTVFFTNPLQHAYPAAQRDTTWRLRPSSPGALSIENLTLRTFGPGSSTSVPIYAWYASLRFHAMHDIRINNVHIQQQNSNLDDRTVEMQSCADVEIRSVDITNNSPDPSAAAPLHSYAFQFAGGTRLIYHTGTVFSFGWAPYVDKTFNNTGGEVGNKTGPSNQLAASAVTQLMMDTSKGENNILDMGGGHENYNRRDICLSSPRGGWYGGGTVLAEVVGLRMKLDMFRITANRSKNGYVHHVRLTVQSKLSMYSSSGTVENWYFSSVVHPGGDSSATWGTFVNCTWTADCTTPRPS